MDFNPDENRFRDSRHEEEEEDETPEEFRPRKASTFTDILSLTSWQADTSGLPDVTAAKETKSSLPAPPTVSAPTDPLQSALQDDNSDKEQQSDEESDEEQPASRTEGSKQSNQPPAIRFPIDAEINGRIALWFV